MSSTHPPKCFGVIHDLLWETAAWVFPDHLQVVLYRKGSFETHRIDLKITNPFNPEWTLVGGLLRQDPRPRPTIFHGSLYFSSRNAKSPWMESIFALNLETKAKAEVLVLGSDGTSRTFRRHYIHPVQKGALAMLGTWDRDAEWSAVLPGNKIRSFILEDSFLVSKTHHLQGDGVVRKRERSTERRFGFNTTDCGIEDVHPTRGDLILFQMPQRVRTRTYQILRMLPRSWEWAEPDTSKPVWTRNWYFTPSFRDSISLFPFEFWDGTVFGLVQLASGPLPMKFCMKQTLFPVGETAQTQMWVPQEAGHSEAFFRDG